MKHASAQRGFTLIELLIVVAIIGVLAAIAIPQYQNYVNRSNAGAAQSEAASYRTLVETAIFDAQGADEEEEDAPIDRVKAEAASNNVTVTVDTSDWTAEIGATRQEDWVVYKRNSDGVWECSHSFEDVTLSNCAYDEDTVQPTD